MSLSVDLLKEILGRVDGITLANAGCVCSDFWSVVRQESLWEEACRSLWPATREKNVKELISSLGGFRKFYADCFPLIAYESTRTEINSKGKGFESLYDEGPVAHIGVPSDLVSVVDVHYKNKIIYSKVVWEIPNADDFQGWFCNCPFSIDLVNFSDVEDDDHNAADGLPIETPRKENERWVEVMENIKLSWILINKRTRQAANFSSWTPVAGQRHWPSDNYKDFVIRFASILPANNILPCKAVQCVVDIKCRLFYRDQSSLKIIELVMKLEDNMGIHVNGGNSLLILERALSCKKSAYHKQILESYQKYAREQKELRQAKIRSDGRWDTIRIASGIVASASFWYFLFST